MALITCPECNGQVSDKATTCPHCGYPLGKPEKGKEQLVSELAVATKPGVEDTAPVQAHPLTKEEVRTGSYLVQCPHCERMTSKYKVLCENCGNQWGEFGGISSDFDIASASPDGVKVHCRNCGEIFQEDNDFFEDGNSMTITVKKSFSCPSCHRNCAPGMSLSASQQTTLTPPSNLKEKTEAPTHGNPTWKFIIGIAATLVIALGLGAIDPSSVSSNSKKSSTSEKSSYSSSSSSSGYSSSSYKSSSSSSSKKYDEDDIKAGVYVLAKKCVKNHLKAPSTAEFTEMWDCGFSKGDDNIYMMTGYVDSENSFGAMLQEQWSIMAEVNGDKVSLVMVTIGDQMYFD